MPSGPLLEVVKAGGVDLPPKLFALITLVAVTNTALIDMLMASRLVYGMSREGIVPRLFGRVHNGRQTPFVAILFTTALGFGLVATSKVEGLVNRAVVCPTSDADKGNLSGVS